MFLSGLMAIGRDGHVVGKDVSPMFDGLAHAAYAQASTIYNYAEAICAAVNTSIENLVRAQYFVPAMSDFRGIAAAFSGRYGDRPQPFWCIETQSPLPAPGAAMIADFWVCAP